MGEVGALSRVEFSSVTASFACRPLSSAGSTYAGVLLRAQSRWTGPRPAMAPRAAYAPRGPMPANRHLSWPVIVRSGASRRRHALPRLALLGPDRSIDLHHQPVRLALGRLEHRESGSRWCCRFYHPLDHFDRTACLRFKRCLQVLDHRLKLLVRQLLDQIAVLDLVLARN